jgi:hypothetical protein
MRVVRYNTNTLFMLGWRAIQPSRACVLITALEEHEITVQEFLEAIEPLSSEVKQVIATCMHKIGDLDREPLPRWRAARAACAKSAADSRNIC